MINYISGSKTGICKSCSLRALADLSRSAGAQTPGGSIRAPVQDMSEAMFCYQTPHRSKCRSPFIHWL